MDEEGKGGEEGERHCLVNQPGLAWLGWGLTTKYIIPHQISSNPTTSNFKISTISNAYISNNSQLIWVKIWILHLMTNPNKVYDTTKLVQNNCQKILNQFWSNFVLYMISQQISTTSNAFISPNSRPIWVKLWILHLRANPNKIHDIKTNLN